MDADNFVYHKDGGKIMAAGYSIDSKLLDFYPI